MFEHDFVMTIYFFSFSLLQELLEAHRQCQALLQQALKEKKMSKMQLRYAA